MYNHSSVIHLDEKGLKHQLAAQAQSQIGKLDLDGDSNGETDGGGDETAFIGVRSPARRIHAQFRKPEQATNNRGLNFGCVYFTTGKQCRTHRSHALDTNTMESIQMRPRSRCTNGGSSLSEDGRSFGCFSKDISNQQTPWVSI